uniref:(California timema) hypothetical protein n=1 Tax=Timema californicum TaxID=61474 RepID=A0A7R9IWT1_TIMCA|nr:unnamed protein product [Timema californicum]
MFEELGYLSLMDEMMSVTPRREGINSSCRTKQMGVNLRVMCLSIRKRESTKRSSPMTSLVLTDSSKLTFDSQPLGNIKPQPAKRHRENMYFTVRSGKLKFVSLLWQVCHFWRLVTGLPTSVVNCGATEAGSNVKNTFNLDMMEHHDAWKSSNYDWLPNLPKGLGEKVPEENLQTLELANALFMLSSTAEDGEIEVRISLDAALKDTYEYLQMFAVGLEQVVIDQKENGGEFLQEFKDTEFKVRATLCEIQVAMVERNVTPKADVTREIMGEELRMMGNSSYRNLRDWLIFRDYMNGLDTTLLGGAGQALSGQGQDPARVRAVGNLLLRRKYQALHPRVERRSVGTNPPPAPISEDQDGNAHQTMAVKEFLEHVLRQVSS